MTLAGWLILVIPLVFEIVVLFLLFKRLVIKVAKHNLSLKTAKSALVLILVVLILQLIARSVFAYFQLKQSTLGVYLLKDHSFLKNIALSLAYPYGEALLVALIMLLVGFLALRFYRRPDRTLIEKIDLYIIFMTTLVVGYPNVFILLIGTFVLMVFIQLGEIILKKKNERLAISPYLLILAIIILILNNFNFYYEFLIKLKLI